VQIGDKVVFAPENSVNQKQVATYDHIYEGRNNLFGEVISEEDEDQEEDDDDEVPSKAFMWSEAVAAFEVDEVSISSTFYSHFFCTKMFFQSFFLVTVWVCNFLVQEYIGAKAARKMLMTLTTGGCRRCGWCQTIEEFCSSEAICNRSQAK